VAESFTEELYDTNVARLKESNAWKTNVKLRNYVEKQWLNMHEVTLWFSNEMLIAESHSSGK
jgi:hypothetical protein